MVDKLVLQMHDCVKSVSDAAAAESIEVQEDIGTAAALIHDADNSKHLLAHLHDVVLRREDTAASLDLKLRTVSRDLHAAILNYLEVFNFFNNGGCRSRNPEVQPKKERNHLFLEHESTKREINYGLGKNSLGSVPPIKFK